MKKLLGRVFLFMVLAGSAAAFDPGEQMQFADGLYSRGLYDMAVQEYLTLLREAAGFDKMDAVLFRIGECHRQSGDKKSADEFYRRLIDNYPKSPFRCKGEMRRGELFVVAGKYLEAIPLLQSLLDQKPPPEITASALYYLGYANKRLLTLGDAESAFLRVLAEFPDSPFSGFAALELAELYQADDGRRDRARALYQKVIEHPATPRMAAEAWFQRAELAYRDRDYPASAEAYEQLLKQFPDDRRAAEARLQAAWSYQNAGQYPEALALADRALSEPGPEDAWLYMKANAARQLQQNQVAVAAYNALLHKSPSGPLAAAAAYEKALLSFKEGNFSQVIQQFQGGGTNAVAEQDLHWLLAESYAALKQDDDARIHYQVIMDKFPESDRAPLAAFRVNTLNQAAGRYREASIGFRQLAEKYPTHELAPDALFSSALGWIRLQQYGEALKDWDKLLSACPEYKNGEEVLYQKAITAMELEKNTLARESLAQFLEKYPKSRRTGEAHHWLAVLYEQAGKNPDAERELRAALAADPDSNSNQTVRFRLATVLQKEEKLDESAALLQELLGTAARSNMPPALLEWLTRYQLDRGAAAEAAETANVLVGASAEAAWQQIGWFLLGEAETKRGQVESAQSAYEKSLAPDARTREGAEAALRLGRQALDNRQFPRAELYFNEAGERSPSSELLDIRARSYYGLGMTARAQERWEDASRYFLGVGILFDNPELTPECLYRAVDALDRLGKLEERDKTFQELKSRYPSSEWTAKAGPGPEGKIKP